MEFDKRLDGVFLNELYDGDAVHATVIFTTFLQAINSMLDNCLMTLTAEDVMAFQKAVHKLKPTLHYVGLTQLGIRLEQLEEACQQDTPNKLLDMYLPIASEIKEMLPLIQEQRDKLSALTINTQ